MRALSSIPVLVATLLTAIACETPTGTDRPNVDQTRLTVAPSTATLVSGGRIQLHFTARDENGVLATPSDVTWATSDPTVATVAPDGVVIGYATGASLITARWNGVHGASTVTVVNNITSSIPCSTSGGGEPLLRTGGAGADQPSAQLKKNCTTQ